MRKDLRKMTPSLYRQGVTDEQLASLRQHANNIELGASLAVEAREKEHSIVYASCAQILKKYPQKRVQYKGCDEKTLRDMKLVMRYCVYSGVLDDADYARDKMHYWYRTIINAFGFGQEFIEDAYRTVQRRAEKTMNPAEFSVLSAMIDDAIAVYNS